MKFAIVKDERYITQNILVSREANELKFVSSLEEGSAILTIYYFEEKSKEKWLDYVAGGWGFTESVADDLSILTGITHDPSLMGATIPLTFIGNVATAASYGMDINALIPNRIKEAEAYLDELEKQQEDSEEKVVLYSLPYRIQSFYGSFDEHGEFSGNRVVEYSHNKKN